MELEAERQTVTRQIAFDLQGAELFYTTDSARPHFKAPNDS